ncbi:MAG: ASPIC/UnbV domain-containing protein, partial [Planctomycetes bacterium]|nr:ASPIC/UnbV domain-containing protein [Planctomycetota bacterium]
GHLQKGHSVACGDWDRDGNIDLFVQMGGAINGDRYHNILFQNPGHANHWITLKLIGRDSNRAALGARIAVYLGGDTPRQIHRHVSTGSSFGANPLEQSIGLGSATTIERIEIRWPTTGKTQVIDHPPVDRLLLVLEDSPQVFPQSYAPIAIPADSE